MSQSSTATTATFSPDGPWGMPRRPILGWKEKGGHMKCKDVTANKLRYQYPVRKLGLSAIQVRNHTVILGSGTASRWLMKVMVWWSWFSLFEAQDCLFGATVFGDSKNPWAQAQCEEAVYRSVKLRCRWLLECNWIIRSGHWWVKTMVYRLRTPFYVKSSSGTPVSTTTIGDIVSNCQC